MLHAAACVDTRARGARVSPTTRPSCQTSGRAPPGSIMGIGPCVLSKAGPLGSARTGAARTVATLTSGRGPCHLRGGRRAPFCIVARAHRFAAPKVLCAPFMGPPRWVIGWAIRARRLSALRGMRAAVRITLARSSASDLFSAFKQMISYLCLKGYQT